MTSSNENSSHRILIVDDNPAIHADFQKVFAIQPAELPDLDDFDTEVVEKDSAIEALRFASAHQGREAVEMVREAMEAGDPFALAFVDMRMPPGMDGLETISELWKIDPELQVVICTAYSDHTWEESVAVLGRTHNMLILKKPFDDVEVLQMAVALTNKWDAAKAAGIKRWELEELVRERTAELERAALHDGLTGLANRLKFNDRLASALQRQHREREPLAVFILDLDQFKYINDTMGHPAGDEVIRVIGQRLSAAVGHHGLVARFGGDEFAIVLDTELHQRSIDSFVTQIQSGMAEPIMLEGNPFVVSGSIGVAMGPGDGDSAEELIRHADVALYRAKADGRDCARFFKPGMDEQLRHRREWESKLRLAVQENQFQLYYQPLMTTASKTIHSFEALLRWQLPEGELVSPQQFIPLAEETGLIVPIGDWVLQEACLEASTWPGDVGVAVNVSAIQFRHGRLPESVAKALSLSGLDPKRLEVEITESVLINDHNDALDQLHCLKELGVRIALDDFGTGYSSLSYLRRFPFDKLKMDKSFVQNLDQADSMAIVSTIANLGKCMGITTTAEGIETEEQLSCVEGEGFSQIQGYLYGRPMPADQVVLQHFGATRVRERDCTRQ